MKQRLLREPAEQRAGQTGEQPEHRQLQAEQAQRLAARQAQAAQQCAGVEAPAGEARRRQGDRHASQQDGGQAGEIQVALGAIQGAADATAAIAGVIEALVGGQPRLGGLPIAGQGIARPVPLFDVAHPAARLHHAGGRQVVEVHQHVGRQAVEVTGFIRQVGQHPGEAQLLGADFDLVTGFQAQRHQQTGFRPHLARPRPRADGFFGVGRGSALELAA
ncbi:hypothetical protein SRABI70_04124 [Pseudomonas sp. Bi70]|nr:hypothetical protein SRABI70_04124 [Pseudomonas sp. Bi70]